ncbi:MAG: hypothetical protein LC777_05855 [Actinobacteria bacterium]|nr:hypothetical protein [Actinomycetota bacterium]
MLVVQWAGRPMRASEIHRASEELLGEQINWSSLKNALSSDARKNYGRVYRVAHGLYGVRESHLLARARS